MAPPAQVCSSFQKQRCKADRAVQNFIVSVATSKVRCEHPNMSIY